MGWEWLCAGTPRRLDTSKAHRFGSRTCFNETQRTVFLGADAYPGESMTANARLGILACLAHELAHWERFEAGYNRPLDAPDNRLDEAETSLRATFHPRLNEIDRDDLAEDARDRITEWLALRAETRAKENE